MDQSTENIIKDFLYDFNQMCKSSRKDFLVRHKTVQYESGPSTKTYNVTYHMKKGSNKYDIIAQTGGWIFKSKFPLLAIEFKGDNAGLKGLYTAGFGSFPKKELKEKLAAYLEECKNLPQNAFTRS